jgi:hypothetical protein
MATARQQPASTTQRGRRDRIARALRHFGLVDRFGLVELASAEVLSEETIERCVARFPNALPTGVSAAALARHIAGELAEGEREAIPLATAASPLTAADGAALSSIPTGGGKAASRYHDQIFRILCGVFADRLTDARKQREQSGRRKRIDITFRVQHKIGFLAEVEGQGVRIPYVAIECKNYSSDPDNPEFDQISGRLNERVGRFGMMFVRRIENRARSDAHCQDRRNDKNEWIIVLDDTDVLAMLNAHLKGNMEGVDTVLRSRFETLVFG